MELALHHPGLKDHRQADGSGDSYVRCPLRREKLQRPTAQVSAYDLEGGVAVLPEIAHRHDPVRLVWKELMLQKASERVTEAPYIRDSADQRAINRIERRAGDRQPIVIQNKECAGTKFEINKIANHGKSQLAISKGPSGIGKRKKVLNTQIRH